MKRKRLYLSQQQQTTKTLTTMTTTIRLQSIGLVPATPAQNIKVGSKLLWNFGYTSEVIEIVKTTAHTITIATKEASGTTYTRRLNKTRLVAIVK